MKPPRSALFRAALGAAAVLIAAAAAYWHFVLAPYCWVSYARHKNMERLAAAVSGFNFSKERLPRSLDELVSAGFLPAEGPMFFSTVRHRTLTARPLPFRECEYDLTFSSDSVTIRIPREDLADKKFSFVTERQAEIWIPR